MPSRETWFCLYQPVRGQTAYLYEFDEPIDAANYVSKVGPELRRVLGRPAKDCFIATIGGESFTGADVASHPWYCYRLLLRGARLGQRLGPYGADDIVSPNVVALPLQQRWRNNVRDARDLLLFLADPTHDRLQAAVTALVAAAHEDRWTGGPALVHELLGRRWGGGALRRHGFTPAAVAAAYRLHGERLKQMELGELGEVGEAGPGQVGAGLGAEVAARPRGAGAAAGGVRAEAAGVGGGVGGAGQQRQQQEQISVEREGRGDAVGGRGHSTGAGMGSGAGEDADAGAGANEGAGAGAAHGAELTEVGSSRAQGGGAAPAPGGGQQGAPG